MKKNKGFTLIELLVVIAIIGILSSVVLASLSSAREKGKDAAVKSQLASAKAQAELWLSAHEDIGYAGVCTDPDVGINKLLVAAHSSSGSATTGPTINALATTAQTAVQTACNDSADAWAVSVPLSSSSTSLASFYCSDNSGLSKETSAPLAGSTDYICD
jgi:prepilin-type N-terminal cleavage/methylation domain-containing protein